MAFDPLISPLPGNAGLPVRRWTPAPVLSASLLLQGLALLAVIVMPQHWKVLLALSVADFLLINTLVMLPRNDLLGANLTRLPASAAARGEIALTFDDGPDPHVTPQVLALLERYRAKASFFCVGERAAAHPELVQDIVHRGHSIENHSFGHSKLFACHGWRWTRRDVVAAQAQLTQLAGRSPHFFRAPAGFRSPLLDPVLASVGLRYASWTRRGYDSVRGDAASVLRKLRRNLAAGDILLLHDGDPARTRDGTPVVLEVLPKLLEEIQHRGWRVVSLPMAFDT